METVLSTYWYGVYFKRLNEYVALQDFYFLVRSRHTGSNCKVLSTTDGLPAAAVVSADDPSAISVVCTDGLPAASIVCADGLPRLR
jgi:hypothetical protein